MVLDVKSSQEYSVSAEFSQGSILGPTLFLLYINNRSGDVMWDVAIYADGTTLYSKSDQTSDPWQQLELASELGSDRILKRQWTRAESSLLISMLEKINWFRLTGIITLVLLM